MQREQKEHKAWGGQLNPNSSELTQTEHNLQPFLCVQWPSWHLFPPSGFLLIWVLPPFSLPSRLVICDSHKRNLCLLSGPSVVFACKAIWELRQGQVNCIPVSHELAKNGLSILSESPTEDSKEEADKEGRTSTPEYRREFPLQEKVH